jgi:hypothetical protein
MAGKPKFSRVHTRSGDDLATLEVYGVPMRLKGDPMKNTWPPHERYHAYLVRLWQDPPESPWRAFVRDCANDEERRFATVEELFQFLHRQTDDGHMTE